MADDFLAEGLLNPDSVPSESTIQDIFWHCLSEAEHTFGPRADGWKYTVKLRQSPLHPETINDGQNQVAVWLTTGRSWVGYYFEAAHEAIHCLNPNIPSDSAKYIEEAIASEFSLEVVRRFFGQRGVAACTISSDYRRARELASEIDNDIIRLGQRSRKRTGALGRVTVEAIEELYPEAPQLAALDSLSTFPKQ